MMRLDPLSSAAVLAAVLLTFPASASAQLAGPNTFGYTIEATGLDYVAPPAAVDPLGDPIFGFGDDEEETLTLPWNFPFYDVDYSSVTIGANGGVRFTTGDVGLGSCLPATFGAPNIAAYWDDLDPSLAALLGGGIYAWEDTANSRYIISWENIEHYTIFPTTDGATFQIHLYPSGSIELHYTDLGMGDPTFNDAASATIGIQDVDTAADLDELQLSCDTADPTLEGTGLLIQGCTDIDLDGFCDTDDCDDTDSAIYPGAPEVCDDGTDDDCNGSDELSDNDADTYIDIACGGDDCDDDDDHLCDGIDED